MRRQQPLARNSSQSGHTRPGPQSQTRTAPHPRGGRGAPFSQRSESAGTQDAAEDAVSLVSVFEMFARIDKQVRSTQKLSESVDEVIMEEYPKRALRLVERVEHFYTHCEGVFVQAQTWQTSGASSSIWGDSRAQLQTAKELDNVCVRFRFLLIDTACTDIHIQRTMTKCELFSGARKAALDVSTKCPTYFITLFNILYLAYLRVVMFRLLFPEWRARIAMTAHQLAPTICSVVNVCTTFMRICDYDDAQIVFSLKALQQRSHHTTFNEELFAFLDALELMTARSANTHSTQTSKPLSAYRTLLPPLYAADDDDDTDDNNTRDLDNGHGNARVRYHGKYTNNGSDNMDDDGDDGDDGEVVSVAMLNYRRGGKSREGCEEHKYVSNMVFVITCQTIFLDFHKVLLASRMFAKYRVPCRTLALMEKDRVLQLEISDLEIACIFSWLENCTSTCVGDVVEDLMAGVLGSLITAPGEYGESVLLNRECSTSYTHIWDFSRALKQSTVMTAYTKFTSKEHLDLDVGEFPASVVCVLAAALTVRWISCYHEVQIGTFVNFDRFEAYGMIGRLQKSQGPFLVMIYSELCVVFNQRIYRSPSCLHAFALFLNVVYFVLGGQTSSPAVMHIRDLFMEIYGKEIVFVLEQQSSQPLYHKRAHFLALLKERAPCDLASALVHSSGGNASVFPSSGAHRSGLRSGQRGTASAVGSEDGRQGLGQHTTDRSTAPPPLKIRKEPYTDVFVI